MCVCVCVSNALPQQGWSGIVSAWFHTLMHAEAPLACHDFLKEPFHTAMGSGHVLLRTHAPTHAHTCTERRYGH